MARGVGKFGGALLLAAAGAAYGQLLTQAPVESAAETRRELAEARAEGDAAAARAEQLEAEAAHATAAADQSARTAAALAARIQQAEAQVATENAEISLIDRQRVALRASIAAREAPLIRLTAALQLLSRRPLSAALLRPGSLADTVHLRALLATMLPEITRRTVALRAEIARGRVLQGEARAAGRNLRAVQAALNARRAQLSQTETRERLAARNVSGDADRSAERALALAEQTRDLAGLVTVLDGQRSLADQLANLPGPVLRPGVGGAAAAGPVPVEAANPVAGALAFYQLPVAGRLIAGFGGAASGISVAPLAGAQVVAPAAGRVGFAGPYRGYGVVVIISHAGGWSSVVTGLAQADVRVGDQLIAGAPLGTAGPGRPVIGVELRRGGTPVNPLEQLRRN